MLIQFSVKNYRAIKHSAVLNLLKGVGDEHQETHVVRVGTAGNEVLRGAAIYGPNAAGKSSVIKAVSAMRKIVVSSTKKQRGEALEVVPYLFDPDTAKAPTEFEVIFVHDDVRYQYGFALTSSRVKEEWLFAYPKGRAQRWFVRSFNEETGEYKWDLGEKLQGKKQVWVEATRENALFLSTAVQLNSEQLKPIYDWFKNKLTIFSSGTVSESYSASKSKSDEAYHKRVLMFLRAADLDIVNFQIEEKNLELSSLSETFAPAFLEEIAKEMEEARLFKISSFHQSTDGTQVPIPLTEESDGTRKIFALAAPFCNILSEGEVVFADELSENLHPLVFKFLISLFFDPEINTGNAQLIFTTHDTSILSQTFLRRDQIWFVDKNRDKSTELYPLSDYMPRKGHERLKEEYLGGSYRGIPLIRRASLFDDDKNKKALNEVRERLKALNES